jgi:phage tail sheath protein FI
MIECRIIASAIAVTVATVKTAETYGYTNPSYVSLYAGWSKFYDKYNDKFVFLPDCIYGAALMARTDAVANVWDAPAGTTRGVVVNNGKNVRFTFEQIGQLSDVSINTTRFIPGIGDVMWMQRTAQQKQSALRDINVRRMLLYVEGVIETLMQDFLFEPNNSINRRRAYNILDSFLGSLNGAFNDGDGDGGYYIQIDERNNTPQVIDNNKMVVDIFLKPSRTTYFVEITTSVTRSGISFTELVGNV